MTGALFKFMMKLGRKFGRGVRRACKALLGRDGDWKMLSGVVAFVIFMLIRMTIGHTGTFTAPVKVVVRAPGVALQSQDTGEVKVELKGAREDIQEFDGSRLKVEIVVNAIEKDVRSETLRIRRGEVQGAGKLRVRRVEPSEIYVRYDPESETEMKLAPPPLSGVPLQGEASVVLKRDAVKVKGPESQLALLLEKNIMLPTEPIDVSGKTQGFTKRVKVVPPTDSGISAVDPEEVEAEVTIKTLPMAQPIYTNAPAMLITGNGYDTSAANATTNTVPDTARDRRANGTNATANAEGSAPPNGD